MPMLHSSRFAGEPTLESVANGLDRLQFGRSGEAVRRVQQALIDLGFGPQSGADGIFGQDTAGAVTRFKSARGIAPEDPVVGAGTLIALDIELTAQEDPRPVLELVAELHAALADSELHGRRSRAPVPFQGSCRRVWMRRGPDSRQPNAHWRFDSDCREITWSVVFRTPPSPEGKPGWGGPSPLERPPAGAYPVIAAPPEFSRPVFARWVHRVGSDDVVTPAAGLGARRTLDSHNGDGRRPRKRTGRPRRG